MRAGDRIRATKGESTFVGEVRWTNNKNADCRIYNDGDDTEVTLWGLHGWAIEVLPEPDLPHLTVVLDRDGFAWQKRASGRWCIAVMGERYVTLDELNAARGPLTLLEVAHA